MDDFLTRLRAANITRKGRWHGPGTEMWSLADWSNAMQGEAGEAGNVVKKIRRAETGTGPQTMDDLPVLIAALETEIADTTIYLDLLDAEANRLRQYAGLPMSHDLQAAIAAKFNLVSEREGFPERVYTDDQIIAHHDRLHGFCSHGELRGDCDRIMP